MTQFTRPSPALVLQVTNARARRPGYEATVRALQHGTLGDLKIGWNLRDLMDGKGLTTHSYTAV